MIIKGARQRCPDSADRLEVVDTRAHQPLHAAEVPQQRAPLRRPQSRDGFQHGFVVAACAPLAMPGDREAMRFVADALDDAQCLRIRAGNDRRRASPWTNNRSWPALRSGPFATPTSLRRGESQLLEFGMHLVDLAQPAVDEQHVRRDALRPACTRS